MNLDWYIDHIKYVKNKSRTSIDFIKTVSAELEKLEDNSDAKKIAETIRNHYIGYVGDIITELNTTDKLAMQTIKDYLNS